MEHPDRLGQIIAGLAGAGGGSFQLSLIDQGPDAGKWAVAVVFGRESADSPMAGGASYGMSKSADSAVQHILDETRWGSIES